MAVKLRLARNGSRGKPFYWLVAANSTSPRDGSFLEKLGTYNPMASNDSDRRLNLSTDKIQKWLSVGAIPTERVEKLLSQASISMPEKINSAIARRDAVRKNKPVSSKETSEEAAS